MIDYNAVQEQFSGLIGYRRSNDTTDADIDADLCVSETGMFVDSIHPLLYSRNLEAAMPDNTALTTIQVYSNSAVYAKWTLVRHGNDVYFSKIDNNLNNPLNDSTKWQKTTLFSHFLRLKRLDSINNVVNKVLLGQKQLGSKELLQNTALFYGNARHENSKHGRFVGFSLTLQQMDTVATLRRVILEFKEAQTIPVYLYHSSQATPLDTFTLNYTNAGRAQVFELATPQVLRFDRDGLNGYYTIGYFESSLNANNKSLYNDLIPFGQDNCSTCNTRNDVVYNKYKQFMDVMPICVDAPFISGVNQTWAYDQMNLSYNNNYGLNVTFSINCDLTKAFLLEKRSFVQVLAAQIKYDYLTLIAHSQRNMQLTDQIRSQAFAELKAMPNPLTELDAAISGLHLDLAGLNSLCVPCENSRGIKWGSAW